MLRNPQLLQAYRNGEESAFLALYEKHATSLRRFLQSGFNFSSQGKMCRFKGTDSSLDAESLVQETFARAFSATTRTNYDGIRPFQTYLFSIAKNLVLRESLHRDRLLSADFIDEAESNEGLFSSSFDNELCVNPEKNAENEELKKITQMFINELDPEAKDFFAYRFARGYTQEGTAEQMGTTRARIKLLEKNVRKRFLEALREHGYLMNYTPNPRWKRQQPTAQEEPRCAAC